MKAIFPLIGLAFLLARTDAQAGTGVPLTANFWLLGDFTQNLPCKGDDSDPAEAKVKVSSDQIISKVGVCTLRFSNSAAMPRIEYTSLCSSRNRCELLGAS